MKRMMTVAALVLASLGAGAQTMYDALNYSDKNYYGTARSIALGNALTAVGGDLGSVTINPAGAAVAGYSQFTITPGLSISSTTASYASRAYDHPTDVMFDSQTRTALPNIGVMMNFNTGQRQGVKSFTLGFVSNTVNNYNDRMTAGGINEHTSMMGEKAYFCNGIPSANLNSYDSGAAWSDVLAYKTGMISTYGGYDDQYVGASELIYDDGTIGIPGPIRQSYSRRHTGSKTDIVMNGALNISDKLYLGINIGIPSLSYTEAVNQVEAAQNPNDFAMIIDGKQAYFNEARQRYALSAVGEGVYAKFGAIWLPFRGFRLGGAITTPTMMTITERWKWDGSCDFKNFNTGTEETPQGEFTYNLVSPWSFNVGAAYTLGNFAMVTADYERVGYGSMRLHDVDEEYGYDSFSDVNNDIRNLAGAAEMFRAGVEIKVIPAFALRAGVALKEYYAKDVPGDHTQAYSCGVGYSSKGSFFADLAFRYTSYPESWFYPYENYIPKVNSPEVNIEKGLMDFVLTLGWRF